jgi:hypothetical protein
LVFFFFLVFSRCTFQLVCTHENLSSPLLFSDPGSAPGLRPNLLHKGELGRDGAAPKGPTADELATAAARDAAEGPPLDGKIAFKHFADDDGAAAAAATAAGSGIAVSYVYWVYFLILRSS